MPATVAAAAIVASSFGGGARAAAVGPCLPPGITLPPGSPHIPPCKKPKAKKRTVRLDIEIRGGLTATDASHQGDRAVSPPDCALQTDPTNCTQKEEGDTVTVAGFFDTKGVPDYVKVTLSPSSVLTYGEAHCPAPFFDGWALLGSQGTVTFRYELSGLDIGQFGLLLGPKHKKGHSTMTLDWKVPKAPCSKFGGPTTPFAQAGGTLDSCTLEADFRLVLKRVD
jgi:hypothetical protein